MPPQPQQSVQALFDTLLGEPSLHVSGNSKHYRSKIVYNVPLEAFSDLADIRLNDVCRTVLSWDHCESRLREIMIKVSRRNEFMVRLTVARSDGSDDWENDIKEFLLQKHPNIVCLCYNQVIGDSSKPSKDYDSFRFLTDQKFLLETTPNGKYTYQISPDTFSEVNAYMEDQQCARKQAWMREESVADVLLVSGRDISSFALCYRQEAEQPVVAIQHDPLVHRDAVINLPQNATVILSSKHDMAKRLEETPISQAKRVHCVMTGGRHGLDPSYLQYLVSNSSIQCILYNSCSTKSLVRDMCGFLKGGFIIDDFQSHDFFPNTKFTASVTKLTRRPPTLILPIGPAGVGKSSLANHLKVFGVECFHRDELYSLYAKEMSGKATRRKLHNDLLDFLQNPLVSSMFVDSTNGDAEGRSLYVQTSQAQHAVLVNFRCDDVNFLLQRTRNRLGHNVAGHPFFPSTVNEQLEKHNRIMQGIQYADVNDNFGPNDTETTLIEHDPKAGNESLEQLAYRVFLVVHVSRRLLDNVEAFAGVMQKV